MDRLPDIQIYREVEEAIRTQILKCIGIERQMVSKKDKWMYRGGMDRQTDKYMDRKNREDRQLGMIEKQTDRWVERWKSKWTDRKFEKQMDRQRV